MNTQLPEFVTLAEGGRMVVALAGPLSLGGIDVTTAHVRKLNAGDILAAQEEAERLVYTATGDMALVMSPARMARASLCRQIARLESVDGKKHDGPLAPDELDRFSLVDLDRVQAAAALLDKTVGLTPGAVVQAADQRGRTVAGSTGPAPAAGFGGPQSGHSAG